MHVRGFIHFPFIKRERDRSIDFGHRVSFVFSRFMDGYKIKFIWPAQSDSIKYLYEKRPIPQSWEKKIKEVLFSSDFHLFPRGQQFLKVPFIILKIEIKILFTLNYKYKWLLYKYYLIIIKKQFDLNMNWISILKAWKFPIKDKFLSSGLKIQVRGESPK